MAIQQQREFAASADRLFQILTDADTFAQATGAAASIVAEPGAAFTCFDGKIDGRFIEIVPQQRIVQAWRVAAWPAGVYSLARFTLTGAGDKTTLTLDHAAYPEEAEAHLEAGWDTMYWQPFKAYLA